MKTTILIIILLIPVICVAQPVGSIQINKSEITTTPVVELFLEARDNLSGVSKMCLNFEPTAYCYGWINYQNRMWVELPSGNGLKTVCVRYQDGAGNVGSPVCDTITLQQ